MPSFTIDDFSGGRNTLDALPLIKRNQHSAGENVWAENRALIKRRSITTAAIAINSRDVWPVQLKATRLAGSSLTRLAIIGALQDPITEKVLCWTDNGTSFAFAGYTDGTVAVSGTAVTGSGTLFLTHAKVGDAFIVDSIGTVASITAIASDIAMTIDTSMTAAAGSAYRVIPALGVSTITLMELNGMLLFDVSGAQNLIVAGDGRGMYRWNGTSMYRLATTIPEFQHMLAYKGYAFGFVRLNATALRWSALRDITSWPTANSQTITTIADPLRAMALYGDSIILFTTKRMFRLTGDTFDPSNPTYVLEEIAVPPNFLFTFSRTVVEHKGLLKFLTLDGWYAYAGGGQIEKISQIIQTDVNSFLRRGQQYELARYAAHARVVNDRLWCFLSELTGVDINAAYVQDEYGAWWRWAFSAGRESVSDLEYVQYSTTGSFVLQGANAGDIGNLNGAVLLSLDASGGSDATWTSGEVVFDNDVEFTHAIITMAKQTAGNLTFGFSVDRRTFVTSSLSMTAGAGTVIRKHARIARVGKAIRVQVANSVAAEPFEIYSIEVFYRPSGGFRV